MRILLLGNAFFGYTSRVIDCLKKEHEVDSIFIYQPTYTDRLRKKLRLRCGSEEKYYDKLIQRFKNKQYDRIFVFGGGASYSLIEDLKTMFKCARFILYLSADMDSYKFTTDYTNLFDICYTYSLSDAAQYGFFYRPWFFSHGYRAEKTIDVSFIGSIHSSRRSYLMRLFHNNFQLKLFFYIYTDPMTYLKYFWKWIPLQRFIHFKELAYEDYIIKLAESRATLDMPTFGQKNVTTRPIEALATQTKIITTNSLIQNYDFFCDDNIFIIENDYSIERLKEWLSRPYREVDYNILKKYELSEWAKDVIQ